MLSAVDVELLSGSDAGLFARTVAQYKCPLHYQVLAHDSSCLQATLSIDAPTQWAALFELSWA